MLLSEYVKATEEYCKNCAKNVEQRGWFYDLAGHVRNYESINDFYEHVRLQLEAQISLGDIEPDITTDEAMKALVVDA